MTRIIQAIFLSVVLVSPAFNQESDSIATSRVHDSISGIPESDLRYADTLLAEQLDFSHSASKALMYALVLPGLGQGYNKEFFKIPIVYAALGGVGYAIVYNTKKYRQAVLDYTLDPENTDERYHQAWRRNMELSYIGLIAVYALQVVDAYVYALLYSWDVNDNLSLRIAPSLQPMMIPTTGSGQAYGFTCRFDLKRR